MDDSKENPFDMSSAVNTWMKFMGQVWGPMFNQTVQQTADQWSGSFGKPESEAQSRRDAVPKGHTTVAAALKNWQAMVNALTTPESVEALLKGSGAMPEVLLKLAQNFLSGYLELQQKAIQGLGRLGQTTEAYKFEDVDENIFRMWTDIYEKEFRQFLQVPQLGLLRSYQEKMGKVADKYVYFQSTISEFLRMLGLPFNRSLHVMHEKLAEMAEQGSLPDDTKDYYNLWIKVLEGHFMTLFQTPEYVETLSRTVNSLAEFVTARDAALEDMIGTLPVAKKSDMDDMNREIYELKKRLRKLERRNKV
jgi:class III poly(R)-hydroxyalkanoic acid synthase PhaE subunit